MTENRFIERCAESRRLVRGGQTEWDVLAPERYGRLPCSSARQWVRRGRPRRGTRVVSR